MIFFIQVFFYIVIGFVWVAGLFLSAFTFTPKVPLLLFMTQQ